MVPYEECRPFATALSCVTPLEIRCLLDLSQLSLYEICSERFHIRYSVSVEGRTAWTTCQHHGGGSIGETDWTSLVRTSVALERVV